MRVAVNVAIIKKGKLLMVRKGDYWIFPGGKIEDGESDLECLSREIGEELSGTQICDEKFYERFEGTTPHGKDMLEARVYFANVNGELGGVRKEDSISESKWIGSFSEYNFSDITSKIVDSLKREGYLE